MQPASSVVELLNYWVPEDQQAVFAQHDYYTKDIDALNVRIISLNTQSCDYKNLFISSVESDPND